ncbi:protein of unknown function (DUF4439) [Streptoalloteichus tenebrarius]|uniref:DUF4439 domain-containing protein n=1 Tax=Streptoalloteichus tenebrarius (strain ATCC 17920 / DSM 40477 / JCM 4838 / CBS 697.72 / NBRC 16177 / NCIMB 11028 / NRRL B-12390 / A12253. 1 / ISP 5477) TaxID=1933 RepID=A0ABT1HN06_STRSD|nr:ferritin-like domain-containing protein [Streptoalloteichus tenebrarius]MCP2256894.1 protein of unknown function (DUF4439) [Streptoalloteichus tenebrarius]BFF00198.1 hypothetical protein GCM10020241_18730 [Streptoalloteichus tenebrarius]
MTSPNPGPSGQSSANGPQPRPTGEAVEAVQRALAAEHAAEWSYGLAAVLVAKEMEKTASTDLAAHRTRREATERMLRDAGATPVPPQPAYQPPKPVTDAASATELLVTAETDTAGAWRAVLERTDDQGLRQFALDALTSAAVRATRWRRAGRQSPLTVPFPGQPG